MERMSIEFTPAAERALRAATAWTCDDATSNDELDVANVLLGLLDEPECRAALMLAAVGIDAAAVQRHFGLIHSPQPQFQRIDRPTRDWLTCLQTAQQRLLEYPQPLALATEHLLLGIAAADNDVSRWLVERGLGADALEAEVHRLSGHQPGPLPFDADDLEPLVVPSGRTAAPLELADPPVDDRSAALRAIDAAANRADEGLRVIEDYLRFVLDDLHLTAECKTLRHELTSALARFPTVERLAARDTAQDVGTRVSLASEQSRSGTAAVARASFKRVQQALRSLEEFSKTIAADAALQFEQLRYRAYTLERAALITVDALSRLSGVQLCVLVDGRASEGEFQSLVDGLVSAGVGMIQLRDKQLADRQLVARARLLAEQTRASGTLFIVNDRPDLAVLAAADGVHVGQDELAVKDARRIVGPGHWWASRRTRSMRPGRPSGPAPAISASGPRFRRAPRSFPSSPGRSCWKPWPRRSGCLPSRLAVSRSTTCRKCWQPGFGGSPFRAPSSTPTTRLRRHAVFSTCSLRFDAARELHARGTPCSSLKPI